MRVVLGVALITLPLWGCLLWIGVTDGWQEVAIFMVATLIALAMVGLVLLGGWLVWG